jgi:hypothetical protein
MDYGCDSRRVTAQIYIIFICREYLHTAMKTYAGNPSEAMQIATKWPIREPAKMSYVREGHILVKGLTDKYFCGH